MRRFLLTGCLAVFALTGCARHYAVTYTNGTRVTAFGKPKLKGNSYVFTDPKGQTVIVPMGRVREIAPASEAESPYNPDFSK
jgi:hypothetical protein